MPFSTRAVIFLIIAAAMAYFLDREERRGGFEEVDRQYRSWLMANSEAEILEPSVTFLAIDDPGERVFDSWPLGPVDYSILVDNLAKNSPQVIAVAPVLGWPGGVDGILLSSMRSVLLRLDREKVLLGAELMRNPSGEKIRATTLSLFPQIMNVSGDRSAIPEFTRAGALPDPALTAISPSLGFTRIDLGDSKAKRKRDSFTVPLLARHDEQVVASFILMAMIKEAGVALDGVEVLLDEKLIRVGGPLDVEIPIDAGGRLSVHTGIREAVSKHSADILILVGAEDIRDQLTDEQKAALLSRIVILGTDDKVSRTIELPKNGEMISQAELFAMAIATIQAKRFIERLPAELEYAGWGALVLIGLLVLKLGNRGRTVVVWGVLLILYFMGSLMLFQYTGKWMPLMVPMGILLSVLLVGVLLQGGRGVVAEAGVSD